MTVHDQQVRTCALCDAPGHTWQECPIRRQPRGWERPKGSTLLGNGTTVNYNTGPALTPGPQSLGPLTPRRQPEVPSTSAAPDPAPLAKGVVPAPGQGQGPEQACLSREVSSANGAEVVVGKHQLNTLSSPSHQGTPSASNVTLRSKLCGEPAPGVTEAFADNCTGKGSQCSVSSVSRVHDDWAEAEAANTVQMPVVCDQGPPSNNDMDFQSYATKRIRTPSPVGRYNKRLTPVPTGITTHNSFSALPNNVSQ